VFDNFHGNADVAQTLSGMIDAERIHQTILLSGPAGIGKATLARRFGAALLGDAFHPAAPRIEQDDLASEANQSLIADREKLPADKRADDPFMLGSHPDFLTFPPDGPLRQISIQQVRLLRERAQYRPLKGQWRVILIDQIDRANEQAANSLLKILEEPPSYLVIIMTADNPYDLLPTIRSRSILFPFKRLTTEEMRRFLKDRKLSDAERRIRLANGCPGAAVSLDLESYDKRRESMIRLLEAGAGRGEFAEWARHAESISMRKTEKLEDYLNVLYLLLEDLLLVHQGRPSEELLNPDLEVKFRALAQWTSFDWIRNAVTKVDEIVHLLRRNIQKSIALDALVMDLRAAIRQN
jgi:DNA polymerase III subunit delta'